MVNSEYLKNLNNAQKEAVRHTDGPLLIVAGAGSGKTKVLTTRIANIIKEKKAFPNQILAVTFTNKAAKEMHIRVSNILGSSATNLSWLGTFHSICAKLLRKHASAANLNSNFTIIDTDDQTRLIKNICKSENVDIKQLSPKYILAIIDKWKNKGFYPNEVIINHKDIYEKIILPIYKIYQQKLIELNSCDFGDLILHTVKILEKNSDIREIYSKNFKYILVDEYQDTNFIQSKWLYLLSEKNNNICCVGDDDQSIYSWRGAEIKNFLEFDQVYKNTKVIRLEQNYRSSQNILSVASNLIANNQNRVGKTLNTTLDERENGLRKILNFGHTFAHAYEASLNYSRKLNHGEAVILGMNTALNFCFDNKLIKKKDYKLIMNHIINAKLPSSLKKFFRKKDAQKILSFMLSDKKNRSNQISLVLLKKIGNPVINKEYSKDKILKFLKKELSN